MTKETVAPTFEEFLLLLGRLNYTWSNTESLLIHLIAGLAGTTKDAAVIIFLTLNTTRARIDLVERLAKMPEVKDADRDDVLAVTGDLQRLAGLRNKYNHCIYSFDAESGTARTILMRIADRKKRIKVGEISQLDDEAIHGIEEAIDALGKLNQKTWTLIQKHGYPV